MKNIKLIMLLVLSFMFFTNSSAQTKKTEPIHTGYVFIDGEYIESPYVIKIVKRNVFINNNLVDTNKIKHYKNPPKIEVIKRLPDLPPDSLSIKEIVNYTNPNTGNNIYDDVFWYYYEKYGYQEACDLKLEFYLKSPKIYNNSIKKSPVIEIITEEGDTIFAGNNIFDWEIKKYKSKREIKAHLKNRQNSVIEGLQERLANGGILLSIDNEIIYSAILNQNKSEIFIKKGIPIINDKSLTLEQKIEGTKQFGFIKKSDIEKIIEKGLHLNNLHERFDKKVSNNSELINSNGITLDYSYYDAIGKLAAPRNIYQRYDSLEVNGTMYHNVYRIEDKSMHELCVTKNKYYLL
ncbi:MAG: hypothetical protein JXR60_07070 [Bacteroidales bacterium]|nr:hypothetical protein [Bacteroidales bacterium]